MTDKTILLEESLRFSTHLNDKNNSRILFSAPFGYGKTTFLRGFVKENEAKSGTNKKKLNFFHLFPVNYSVASNEDIFQYVKYDIIYSLIDKGITFEKADFNYLKGIKTYLKANAHVAASKLLLLVPQVGKDLLEIFDDLNKIKDDIIDACEQKPGEAEKFHEYLLEAQNRAGSIYEFDIYTQLISGVLKRIKEENAENILIIDDLDRIDPAHIFRLLNVFSAHLDHDFNKNKFGFDKIVFVCDINNIRKIFAHAYGIGVDFNGYIDKFYSSTIFDFLNYKQIRRSLEKNISEISNQNRMLQREDILFSVDLISIFLINGLLNYRAIEKITNFKMNSHFEKIELTGKVSYEFTFFALTKVGFLLIEIFGSYTNLVHALTDYITLNRNGQDKSIIEIGKITGYLRYIIPVITYQQHDFVNGRQVVYGKEGTIFLLKKDGDLYYVDGRSESQNKLSHKEFYSELLNSLQVLNQKGVF